LDSILALYLMMYPLRLIKQLRPEPNR